MASSKLFLLEASKLSRTGNSVKTQANYLVHYDWTPRCKLPFCNVFIPKQRSLTINTWKN